MIYILLGIIAVLLSLIRYHYHQLRLLRQKLSNLEYQVSEAHEALSQAHGVLEKQKEFIQSHLASDENILKVERKRIADDLHDDTVQRLVLVRLRMQQLLYYRIPAQVEAEVNQLQREMN
ncbi:MAG: histidine kinase [Cyclobacteriaceae bacterium]|jgi:signal transduction histidine kinase|nr:histidine kinase [Cyclobacteriaceae bacterium]